MADNELSCDGTFTAQILNAKDSEDGVYVNSMCTTAKLAVDTTALTMCAERTMRLPLPLRVCIGRSLPSRLGTLVHVLRAET